MCRRRPEQPCHHRRRRSDSGRLCRRLDLGAAQTLKGNGTVSGSTTLAGTVAPGTASEHQLGITAGTTTLAGKYACEVAAASTDLLAVTGKLTVTSATLDISADP